MYPSILTPEQTKLLPLIQKFSSDFYLVGGTALALQYGHRHSLDFDLFSAHPFDNTKIRRQIMRQHTINVVHIESTGEYTMIIDGIKTTFYHYDFPIHHPLIFNEIISMPDDLTIGAMKAYAMGQRNKWKDYADLYFIFQHHSLQAVIERAEQLFGIGLFNSRLFREQLCYHTDISYREPIEWMPGYEVTKEKILAGLIDIATSWCYNSPIHYYLMRLRRN